MKPGFSRPDTEAALRPLKNFQLQTVEYVFKRLYDDGARRFLIADEVGLGKTMVARGVVAKAIERLWPDLHKLKRLDIIYICSNVDIARQNVDRLNVFDASKDEGGLATRLTLLPLHLRDLDNQPVNFVSFTPGTSFNLRSSGGIAHERALLYHLLRKAWRFGDSAAPKNIFQYWVTKKDAWRRRLERMGRDLASGRLQIDKELKVSFVEELRREPEIKVTYRKLRKAFGKYRKQYPPEIRAMQGDFIGLLRRTLARACVHRLEPDIIILDEFQRFKGLLFEDNDAAQLARSLFEYEDEHTKPRLLLLSATPYKSYTLYQEADTEDHYKDFISTMSFLFHSARESKDFKKDLRSHREALMSIGSAGISGVVAAKQRLEQKMRKVMVRTERLSIGGECDGMLREVSTQCSALKEDDLFLFAFLDRIVSLMESGDTLGYWKSAPYLLNLMDRQGYKIKRDFVRCLNEWGGEDPDLVAACRANPKGLLRWNSIESYRPIPTGNGRMRSLLNETTGKGAWQFLWIPPCVEYYRPDDGPYADRGTRDFSKVLVFSSWQIVPKAVAMLSSYEAERCMMQAALGSPAPNENTYSAKYSLRPVLLDYAMRDGKPDSMNSLVLFYPCVTLATAIDPLAMAHEHDHELGLQDVRTLVASKIKSMVAPLLDAAPQGGRPDQAWYWAALALLDRSNHADTVTGWRESDSDWCWVKVMGGNRKHLAGCEAHVDKFWDVFDNGMELGSPPADLVDVLTSIALGSPAVTMLRSFLRHVTEPDLEEYADTVLGDAAFVSAGFRTLFNVPAVQALLRAENKTDKVPYWQKVLHYCESGNLQSVLDEYVHISIESLGLFGKPVETKVEKLSVHIERALTIRTVNLDMDEIKTTRSTVSLRSRSIRCRFGLRFGDGRGEHAGGDDDGGETRKEQVRDAFNSPFWPFVLATTSIGQEGLDFHQYCHNVVHWNLPSNPVDLEQREGRIHRYKGHAIRKNVAGQQWCSTSVPGKNGNKDVWADMFDRSRCQAHQDGHVSDLVPFWTFPDASHKVNRRVLGYPLSCENARYDALKDSLVTYRLVFGQNRQEDLLAYLRDQLDKMHLDDTELDELLRRCVIDLAPPP